MPDRCFSPWPVSKRVGQGRQKNLKAEIDEELIETYRGKVSLPFEAGDNKRIAVKIVDDRGIVFEIPCPPLAEQHRIVAKVDELMALCDTLKFRLNNAQTTQNQLINAIIEQTVA